MLTARNRRKFGIQKEWEQAGYFETQRAKDLSADIIQSIKEGRLITVTGPVGVGKTVMMRELRTHPQFKQEVIFARALSIDKPQLRLSALITALFLDLAGDPDLKIPAQSERRERLLQTAIHNAGKPVALCIDEAHDLNPSTLNGLKRLLETLDTGSGTLAIVLIGHPRLHHDLQRPTMEEIGHRTRRLILENMGNDTASDIDWLFTQCLRKNIPTDEIIEPEARAFLADKLQTPLQIAEHLDRAFADAYRTGADKVTRAIVESTISVGFEDLDARLARIGTAPKTRASQFDLSHAETRRFLKGRLDTDRTAELTDLMRSTGLPL